MRLRIQALLLAFMLVMPVVFTSITEWGNTDYRTEFCDTFPGEEREEREERKTEKEKDVIEEFDLGHQNQMGILCGSNSKYLSASNLLASVSDDVLTPPPEFI